MYSKFDEEELCNSPDSIRNGLPSTINCTVTPRFDPNDKAVGLLLALTANTDGLIYAYHTFYDATGSRILGTEGDPARMQYTK